MRTAVKIAIAGTSLTCLNALGAASTDVDSLNKLLDARFAIVTGEIWSKKQAAKFVSEFYTENAIGTMEGATTVYSGAKQLTDLMTPFVENYEPLQFHPYSLRLLGPKAAAQLVLVDAVPKDHKAPTLHFKCFYAWTKTAKGWRVATDMCANGGMDAAKQ